MIQVAIDSLQTGMRLGVGVRDGSRTTGAWARGVGARVSSGSGFLGAGWGSGAETFWLISERTNVPVSN